MLANLSRLLIHMLGAALACALLAYWSIRLMTPPAAPAPAPARGVTVRDPDPVLLARAFGQVERAATASIGNIQVAGVFSAGRDSAAVFVVGDRPARAVRLGQEVAPGSTLVEVDPTSVTLDSGGVRRQLRVPSLPVAGLAAPGAVRGASFVRRGNELTAPMMEATPAGHAAGGRSPAAALAPRLEPRPEPPPGPAGRREMIGTPTVAQ
jgi:general secretion pathway protein C